ncbi:MAG: NUDIX domain-containing protein [archaeon]
MKVGVGFGVMILKNSKVLLGKRHVDPEKADSELEGAGKWTMPGGKLHYGETFEEGAKREVMEETGMVVNNIKFISITNNIVTNAHFVTLGFLCEDFEDEPEVKEPDEITEWKWFDIKDLPTPMYEASMQVIKNYNNKIFYSS